jgi:hypothetical protein
LPPMLRRAELDCAMRVFAISTVLDFLKTRLRLAQVSSEICPAQGDLQFE